MFKILKYLKVKEYLYIAISTALIVAQVFLDLKLPEYMEKITIYVQTEGSNILQILQAGGLMLACAIGSLILAFIVGYFTANIAATFAKRLRYLVFDKVENFSFEEINKFSTASLITRSTNDVTQVQMVLAMGLQVLIKAPIVAVWAIIKISNKSWQWTGATGVAVVALLIMIGIIVFFALPKFKKIQGLTDNLTLVTRENLTGLRVVRAYNAENYQENKFNKANVELCKNYLYTNRIMAILNPGMNLISSGLNLSIYWIGAVLISKANMLSKLDIFSNMVVFSSYAMQVVFAFVMLSMVFIMMPRASVSAKRINEVLKTIPKIVDGVVDGNFNFEKTGEVEFRNVSFRYPDAKNYVLKNISFVAKQGETVAFIGATGSGKSTLVNLILRFYDASEGTVLVDGVPVQDYKKADLYNKLGYVSQKAVIFSGDITSNVAYGENAFNQFESSDVKSALEIAQAKEFVEKMNGCNAEIAQGGTNISGGQKQRLAIARAIARKPEIFIFDDSFSALDYKTDRLLRKSLRENVSKSTNLIVAQRIGTIKEADKILVLEDGNIVGMGKHAELMNDCKVYQEIAFSQLSKEELIDA